MDAIEAIEEMDAQRRRNERLSRERDDARREVFEEFDVDEFAEEESLFDVRDHMRKYIKAKRNRE